MSEFGGEAENICSHRVFRILTQGGNQPLLASVGKRAIFSAKKPKTPVQVGVDCGRCERLGEPLGRFLSKVPNNGSCRSHICSPRRRRGKFETTPNPRRCLQGIPRFGV